MHNALRAVWREARKPLFRGWETNHDPANTLFLAGSGRSGTTWLSEIINADRSFRSIFEPFNSRKTREWQGFAYRQYLPRMASHEHALIAANTILSGRVHNDWVDSQNRVMLASRRLVKDIRANLMLGWLKENFPRLRIVLIVRHPLAVAASRIKLHWEKALTLEDIRAQPALIRDFLGPHMPSLERWAKDDFSLEIVDWCIENMVPLAQLAADEYHLVSYEALVARPETELRLLFQYLGLRLTAKHHRRLGVLSAMSSRETLNDPSRERLLRAWQGQIDENQKRTADEIVGAFGLGPLLDRCVA